MSMQAAAPMPNGRTLLSAVILCVATACTTSSQNPADLYELGNMDPVNAVPKSSPKRLVSTFETSCIDGPRSLPQAEARLRSAGFVPLPRRNGNVVIFVSDDSRPAVILSGNSGSCAVAAEARTGQANAIASFVAKRFPTAAAVDPRKLSKQADQVWQTPEGIIFTSRSGPSNYHSRLMLGIWRSQ